MVFSLPSIGVRDMTLNSPIHWRILLIPNFKLSIVVYRLILNAQIHSWSMHRHQFPYPLTCFLRHPLLVCSSCFFPLNYRWSSFSTFSCNVQNKSIQETFNQISIAMLHKFPSLVESLTESVLNDPSIVLKGWVGYIESLTWMIVDEGRWIRNNFGWIKSNKSEQLRRIIRVKVLISENTFKSNSSFSFFFTFDPIKIIVSSLKFEELVSNLFSLP